MDVEMRKIDSCILEALVAYRPPDTGIWAGCHWSAGVTVSISLHNRDGAMIRRPYDSRLFVHGPLPQGSCEVTLTESLSWTLLHMFRQP